MELGRDPDRREEAEGNLTANRRPMHWVAPLALVAGLAAGSTTAAEPGKCTLVRIAEWAVRSPRGQPVVDGAINGQQIGVMLDTGAARSIILRSAADRLALIRYNSRGSRMIGVGGESAVETVSIDEFALGSEVRRNWRMLVAGEHEFGPDIAVILGEDFLSRTDVEFDLAHDAVRLFQARDCEGKDLAYWTTEGAGVVGFDASYGAGSAIELAVEVNGRPLRAQLDSGASSSVLTKSQAASIGVTPESKGVVAAGCSGGLGQKAIEIWLGSFETFRIGDELVRDPRIRFADIWRFSTIKRSSLIASRPSTLPDMLLSADFLRAHRVLVAHSQRKMYFTYAGGTVFPPLRAKECNEPPRAPADPTRAPASR